MINIEDNWNLYKEILNNGTNNIAEILMLCNILKQRKNSQYLIQYVVSV